MYFLLVAGFPAADNFTLLDLWVQIQSKPKNLKRGMSPIIKLICYSAHVDFYSFYQHDNLNMFMSST